jgi:two-component system CheB/CheR fusion protein
MKKKLLQSHIYQIKKDNLSQPNQQANNNIDADGYFLNIYEQIVENSQDIFYCLSYPQLEILYISPSIKDLTGKSREEFISQSSDFTLSFIHPSDKELFLNHFKSLNKLQSSKSTSIVYRIKPPHGIYRWINDSHSIIFDTQDGSSKIVGSLHDITDQKLMEDAMKRSRDRLYMAIEATNDGMWDWHLVTNELYFDQRFYTMLGYEPYEFPASFSEWMNHIHPDDTKMVQKHLEKYLENKLQQWVIEYRFKAKNNNWVWILNRGKVFERDEDDKPLRMIGVHTDITKQKKNEEALIAAKEKALESDRLKSAFLANISHEIRTPMNGIIGFASLLKERVLPAEKRNQFIDIIVQSSNSLLHVIEDILDISKLEANQLDIIYKEINLNELFSNLYSHFIIEKQLYGKDHIELKTDIEGFTNEFIYSTDETRLHQILSNLLSNALKFTEKGIISFGYKVLFPDRIQFFVRDTGIGISQEQKPHLFKHFRQHETTPTRHYGGTGLGLAISEGLVELMGGHITFKSNFGEGSEFQFILPYNKTQTKSLVADVITNQLLPYNWNNKVILLVEDDLINQEYFKTILMPFEVELLLCLSGEEAIECCKNEKNIDLILLDIRLPHIDGYETFKKIKEINPIIPVIAQTAFAMPNDTLKCIEMGFSDYISKPINKKELFSKIDYIFSKK